MSVGQQNTGQPNPNQRDSGGAEPAADVGALKQDASQVAEAAVERGREFVDSARAQATGYVDQRKNDLAQSVADLARALRDASQPFDDRPNIKALVDNAAGGLDQFADTIRTRSVAEIYADMEELLRRRPAAVAATTLAAGFLLSRFIKASAENMRGVDRRAVAERRRATGARSPASAGSSGSATVRI